MPDVLKDGPSNPSPRPPVDDGTMNQLMRVASIGTNVAFAVIAGSLLGLGVDWLAGTRPWGLLVGAGVGVIGGLVTLIRESRKQFAPRPLERPPRPPSGDDSRPT